MLPHLYDETFAVPAARGLLDDGKLSEAWMSTFTSIVLQPHEEPAVTWRAGHFRLLRFVSMYLPLRYFVWCRSFGKNRPETELALAELGRLAETSLWRKAMKNAGGTEHTDDVRLASWVFESVDGLCSGRIPLDEWDAQYHCLLDVVSPRWRMSTSWSRWTCMAIHFASFYLDVGLIREIDEIDTSKLSDEQQDVLHRIGDLAGSATAKIVAAWLAGATAARDGAGTLLCGRPKSGARKTTVRGHSEIVLMDPTIRERWKVGT